jgi:intein-encoded DNA endonuclease-like protein
MKKYHNLDLITKLRIYNYVIELRRRSRIGAVTIKRILQEKLGVSIATATVDAWINHGATPIRGPTRNILIDDINLDLINIRKYQELSLEERLKLYEEALVLNSMGFKPSSITTVLKLKHGVEINKGTVGAWIYNNSRPRQANIRPPINLTPSVELAIIAAASVSDGSVTKEEKPRFSVQMKDHEPIELIIDCLEKVTGYRYKDYYSSSTGAYIVQSGRRALCEYLANESNILDLLHRFLTEFLRMFFEAEGGPVGTIVKKSRKADLTRIIFHASIAVSNSNIRILEEARKELLHLGIRSSIRLKARAGETKTIRGQEIRYKKPCYEVIITSNDSIKRYSEKIGFISRRKREKLDDIINILEKYGKTEEGAIEWVRRYRYCEGGRERWIRRQTLLSREEAISELSRLLRERRKNEQAVADHTNYH